MIQERLLKLFCENWEGIRAWEAKQAQLAPPPFYCSVDLRVSDLKIAPVDCNLYPAGFNNICPADQETAKSIFRDALKPHRKILILPESHTSNSFYHENLYFLKSILQSSGMEVEIGWCDPLPEPLQFKTPAGYSITVHPIAWGDRISIPANSLRAEPFVPDAVVLNNDFSSGYPKSLDAIEQPLFPTHRLGWHSRKKSSHFHHYQNLVNGFSELIGLDPWHLSVETIEVSDVNFNEGTGLDRVAAAVSSVLKNARVTDPFAFVKSNSGTYGMGIMVVKSEAELFELNRREKNKMSVGKNRAAIESVIVQEGIPTTLRSDQLPAEPVIYMCESRLVGGFLRVNTERSSQDNLNAKGMLLKKLCVSDFQKFLEQHGNQLNPTQGELEEKCRAELIFGTIARLSALAAGRELKDLNS